MSEGILAHDDFQVAVALVAVHRIVLAEETIPVKDADYFIDRRITALEMDKITKHSDRRIGIIRQAIELSLNRHCLLKRGDRYSLGHAAPLETQPLPVKAKIPADYPSTHRSSTQPSTKPRKRHEKNRRKAPTMR